uniref:ADP/ATP translocase n=1 Tax=Entomoneis paludosa TaxID=265537 RepID=A0A7S2Y3S7_9STRA|mmetsp:Transcript_15235/g.31415  ORF Transcript_15235/g.31415 Transcript_15235/m.31415 type:complete len:375 (+) Transcript_15235:108-1232(+)
MALESSTTATTETPPTAATPTTLDSPSTQPSPAQTRRLPQWRDAVAGAGAGALSRTVMAPLERLKIMRQLRSTTTTTLSKSTSSWQLLWHVYQTQGVFSFWRGNTPAVLRVAGTASINFTCLAYYKQTLVGPLLAASIFPSTSSSPNQERTRQFLGSLVAGGLAGATSTTIMYPLEFARTRLAMDMGRDDNRRSSTTTTTTTSTNHTHQRRQYRGMWDVVRQISASPDGPLGLYKGYGIALVGGIFYRVLYLGGYDAVKNDYAATYARRGEALSLGERFVMAQGIALTAGTLSYPLDSIRRRLMMQAGQSPQHALVGTIRPGGVPHYRNAWHCIQHIWATEGVSGFFLGLGPNVLRSLGGALVLVAYDSIRTLL